MLTLLKISNMALADHVVWEPGAGLLAVTGETGAGKSVVTGAVGLALGGRCDKSVIRGGEEQCCVEAVFHLENTERLDALLDGAGVPACEEGTLLIRRVVSLGGNRQFINSSPVTLRLLREAGGLLADMYSAENERVLLASPERRLALLDAFAENLAERREYDRSWRRWTRARQAWREFSAAEQAQERELDFLRHQIDEIESAAFTAEEADSLESDWRRARNAERLLGAALPLVQLMEGEENGLLEQMRRLVRGVRELERLDPACPVDLPGVESLADALGELETALEDYAGRLERDPAGLARLEERVGVFDALKRKYGSDFAAIQEHLAECRRRLGAVERRGEVLAGLESEMNDAEAVLREAGERLTGTRRHAAPRFAEEVLRHARELGFRQAAFEVSLLPEEAFGRRGAESAVFLFGPNPGEPLRELQLAASGGELARVMLALKSALAERDEIPLLVFDEIDANVGGEIALAVGRKLSALARRGQVVAITHFPQVAALADHHYLVEKRTKDGRTASSLREVSGEIRVDELVRMLGGGDGRTRDHARELIERKVQRGSRRGLSD